MQARLRILSRTLYFRASETFVERLQTIINHYLSETAGAWLASYNKTLFSETCKNLLIPHTAKTLISCYHSQAVYTFLEVCPHVHHA